MIVTHNVTIDLQDKGAIPQILTSGNHEKVRQWRRKQALRRTRERRPDMYEKLDLSSKQDKKLLKEMAEEDAAAE